MKLRSSGQPKKDAKNFFSHPPSPFPSNFATATVVALYCFTILGSTSIVIHRVKQRLLRNRPRSDAATSCMKDYKGHSLVQTSFTEPANSSPSGPETQFTNYPLPTHPPVSILPSAVLNHYHTVQTHFPGLSSSPPMEC